MSDSHGGEHTHSPDVDGRSPDDIERDIENTRNELNDTLSALESKFSPRARLNALIDSARTFGSRVTLSAGRSLAPGITSMIRLDHTHVLALFRRFRPQTSPARKRALAENACLALEVHAQLEEEIFYPAMHGLLGKNDALDKSVPEHDAMRKLIEKVRGLPVTDSAYDETVRELMGVVLHHVADEESKLLPLAETLMPDRLAELGWKMTRRRVELLRPHTKELAGMTARSFPIATAAGTGLLAILAWRALRPRAGK